ncbi:MAG: hypothetical protein DRQ35_03040 [Gammaproteobacteria bacterium]|nr:MAG: hypothetical protein DRQ35_03040 [Gammaproteobacteria bacterium]
MDKMSEVTDVLVSELYKWGVSDSYLVVPSSSLEREQVQWYWNALAEADTLQYRWSDVVEPKADEVGALHYVTPNTYFVVDVATRLPIAEFALCNFTGKAAQVHFSMHPVNPTSVSLFLAEHTTNLILNNWAEVENLEKSYLDTLYGVTPKKNRVACLFIRKVGFTQLGVIPSGTMFKGEVDDALLTIKERLN